MAKATVQDIKTYLGVTDLDQFQVQAVLDVAERFVILDGVEVSHEDFQDLHLLRTLSQLPAAMKETFADVIEKQIGDVRRKYGGTSSQMTTSQVLEMSYYALREKVVGYDHNLA